VAEVLADPVRINTELGRYTNFVNLLDLCALAIPAGIRSDGLPFGITLIAPRGRDNWLAGIGRRLHASLARTLGATGQVVPAVTPVRSASTRLAKLAELGAQLSAAGRTKPDYRLYALSTTPPKPGLVRVTAGTGKSIELEVWELSHTALGQFIQNVRAPLCIGTVELESGEAVHGFLCEAIATEHATDITAFGGWLAYRASNAT
jgi:allophanate hydrolase